MTPSSRAFTGEPADAQSHSSRTQGVVQQEKDAIGFNIAGLRHIQQRMEGHVCSARHILDAALRPAVYRRGVQDQHTGAFVENCNIFRRLGWGKPMFSDGMLQKSPNALYNLAEWRTASLRPRTACALPGPEIAVFAVKCPSRPSRPHKSHHTKIIHYGERRTLRARNYPRRRARTKLEGAEFERQLRKLLSLCRTSVSCSPIISATSAAFGSSWSNAESICPRPSGVPFSVIQYDVHF